MLEGKTALVTGGSRGIGRAIAIRLARSGALVAINYASDQAAAEETLATIERESGKAFLIRQKLGSLPAAQQVAIALEAGLVERTGANRLDVLVNNAGKGIVADLEATTPEIFEQAFTDNAGATLWMTRAVLRLMGQGGSIINISSTSSLRGLEVLLAYSMAKAAVDNFTKAMAKHLGPRGIRVNSVLPGFVATDATAAMLGDPATLELFAGQTVLRRPYGMPEEIAELVHALAGPDTGWVTGQIIQCNGGYKI
jgi:NAD(P)-dependent dehydrogenase (short-subunit alcohol dehydrogenase family)